MEKKKEFIEYILDYEYNKLELPKPDKVIFLHIPNEEAKKLREERKKITGLKDDIHEKDDSFMDMVYDSSIIVSKICNFEQIECIKNGKLRAIEDINNEIMEKLENI